MEKIQSQIQSLDRAFTLIDIIANSDEPLSLGDITKRAGLPKPTVYRILSSLETWDYVDQDKNGYKLGTRLLLLGTKAQESLEIKEIARPFLKELNKETNETVFLGVIDKGKGLYVDKLDSGHSVRLVSKVGSRNYLHSTGLGKSLLLGLTVEEIDNIIAQHGLPPLTKNTITNRETLLKHLEEGKRRGYVIDNLENEEGVRCIAAPIKNHEGKIIAAVSVSGPAQRITDEAIEGRLKKALLKTSTGISAALGYVKEE